MGCDYYISKKIYIYFNNNYNNYLVFELSRTHGYYCYDYDEDELDYQEKMISYKERALTPQMKSIILYENNNFNKSSYETTYKTLVEQKAEKYGKKWEDISKIEKVEERFERE